MWLWSWYYEFNNLETQPQSKIIKFQIANTEESINNTVRCINSTAGGIALAVVCARPSVSLLCFSSVVSAH